ncbi:ABC transporter B family member 25 [Hordeum vulgare]|nr:ABC transporter B family member 25 [Hordeum vulgare]
MSWRTEAHRRQAGAGGDRAPRRRRARRLRRRRCRHFHDRHFRMELLCEESERHRNDEELKDLLFKQAVTANLATKDKDDEWQHIREEQREKFIDLISSDKQG